MASNNRNQAPADGNASHASGFGGTRLRANSIAAGGAKGATSVSQHAAAQTMQDSGSVPANGAANRGLVRSDSSLIVEPTTHKELLGWWIYMAAVEPISIIVIQLFLPSLFASLGKQLGYVNGFPNTKCDDSHMDNGMCIVASVFGILIPSTTFSYGIISVSALLLALLFVSFGALADYGGMRKRLLAIVTFVGSMICVSMVIPVSDKLVLTVHALQNILITMAFGIALMLYNSYLPLLAASHPETTSFNSDDPIEKARAREVVSSSLSAKSMMFGYGSGALLLLCFAVISQVFKVSGNTLLTYGTAATGLFWLLVAIFPLIVLKPRRGPSIPAGSNYLTFSFMKLMSTVRKWKRLPHTFRYLFAFFLFSDGCNTMGTIAVVFAKTILQAQEDTLIICSLIAPICGVLGNLVLFRIQKKLHLTSMTMLLIILVGMICLGLYTCLGLVTSKIGMMNIWELYPISGTYGFLIGPMLSFSRVIFGELVPPGEESEFFGLYAITDKGSAWVGPLVLACVGFAGINQRVGILILLCMIVIPIPILVWRVDTIRGKEDALRYVGAKTTHDVKP